MNNIVKIIFKEFLGYGLLITVALFIVFFVLTGLVDPILQTYITTDWQLLLINLIWPLAALYLSALALLYFFAKKLNISDRKKIFLRTFFWVYLAYFMIFKNISKMFNPVIFHSVIILGAAIIPFFVIPPKRKSNG
jgi:hypothetical protein